MKKQKWPLPFISTLLCLLVMIPFAPPAAAASGPTLSTTLSDQGVQKGSKKTFEVWARNASGNKIKATVTCNGEKLSPTWDDNEKSSYTLLFSKEGETIVVVSASSDGGLKKQLTYRIHYQKAKPGEAIGTATWSIELFTIGCGYLVYPVEVSIYEGETSAEQLIRLLQSSGYVGYYGGGLQSAFYLGYIADGTAAGSRLDNYQRSPSPASPKKLSLSPAIPSVLVPHLKKTMTFYDPEEYTKNRSGYLGEFSITNGSGWMYSVNNVFPNVSFSDTFLSDGDTVRVQFTLGYGADIGGFDATKAEGPLTSGYFQTANKDSLTKAIRQALHANLMTKANVKKAYASALSAAATLDASQGQVDAAVSTLKDALLHPSEETTAVQTPVSSRTGGNDSRTTPSYVPGTGHTDTTSTSGTEPAAIAAEATAGAPTTATATDLAEPQPVTWILPVIILGILLLAAGGFCAYWFYWRPFRLRKQGKQTPYSG